MPIREPQDVKFGEKEMEDLEQFVFENITSLKQAYAELHETKVPEWRRLYKGLPQEETRNFPWANASNVVIQLIGENCDILKANIIGSIYEILPLWVSSLVGDWNEQEEGEEQRAAIESFMNLMGLEPTELDLMRVESLACNDMVKLGTVVVKCPWETDIEQMVVATDSTERGEPASSEFIKYDGPRPEKLAYEDWAASPEAPTWEKAAFKYHKYTLRRQDLEYKAYKGIFTNTQVLKIINSPDREGPDQIKDQKLQEQNINAPRGNKYLAEWDIYECWFTYYHNHKKYSIIYPYHLSSRTPLRPVFNFYPDNSEPFELGRLGYTDDGLIGYGFAEMLKFYQEDVTTGHNQRNDSRTLANTWVIFGGRNPRIDAGISVFPTAVLPLSPDEASIEQLGRETIDSVNSEQLTIALAKARAGVDNGGVEGAGGGSVNKKGAFSAMGTFALMQAGNRRVNINIGDFRYLHLKLGRKFLNQYAEFGIGSRKEWFGEQSKHLLRALENIKKHRMELPIRAATASINKELEKQNDMLLMQVSQRSQQATAQILQGLSNPAMPPLLGQYLIGVIGATAELMGRIYRNFGHDDISRLVPEMATIKTLREKGASKNGQQNVGGEAGGTSQSGGVSSVQQTSQEQGPLETPSLTAGSQITQ